MITRTAIALLLVTAAPSAILVLATNTTPTPKTQNNPRQHGINSDPMSITASLPC